MRTVVLGCLLASVLSTIVFTGADAQTYCSVNQAGVTTCVNAYTAAATGGTNICEALDDYIGCLSDLFSCNPYYASVWNSSMTAYRSVWDQYCTLVPALDGVSAPSMVFGDPHYRLTNGTYQTCDDLGTNVLASNKYYIVNVVHSSIGSSTTNGTVVTEVSVSFYHIGAPAGTFTWTLSDSPSTASKGGISVTSSGIEAKSIGLNLKVTRKADHLILGLVTKKLTGGILLNGCVGTPVALPTTISGECAAVPAAYQASCAFDAQRTNESWAVASSNSASTEEKNAVATAESQNGVSGQASLSFVIAAVFVCIFATLF